MESVKNWKELTPRQRQEERFKRWLNAPGVRFDSPEAKKQYRARVTRFINAIRLEEGDRVPCMLPVGYFPAYYAGYDLKTVMYDYVKQRDAWLKFMRDFGDMDSFSSPGLILPAPALEIIDHKMHKWPGHGVGDDVAMYQFVEGEYIKADEYDKLIKDPTDFWLRTFMPREAGAFAPLADLPHLTPFIGIPIFYLSAFGNRAIQSALKTMMKAGNEIVKWSKITGEVARTAMKAGYPPLSGGMSGAPFDMLTDMCRGTTGIIMDMFRQPEKIIEAADRITPIVVDEAVKVAENSISPVIIMPLHKGDKTFMSQQQFEKFYWPSFKKVLLGLINEGLVPMPFAEGNYIPRLETISDMPRASIMWYFEYMDMALAKKIVGKTNGIMGNLPISIMATGTPEDVKEGCRKLIETCAPGGGYILSAAASMDKGNVANLHAMMDAAKEYGVYK
ncbi:MAG: uroporphyrinogen decarboxylase family protein [Dehalococcoidales bacterium]